MNRVYICIDLKSFYASVECVLRGLDPLNTNLVVADKSRTEKTICLAVSPSLKKYGLSGRSRLFEVVSKVKEINNERKHKIKNKFTGSSYIDSELMENDNLSLDYIVAVPRMAKYIEYSTKIYGIYLKYVSKDDIFAYSIDEVFCDITDYLKYYQMDAGSLVTKILNDIHDTTGITATAGIGTNMYLAKVAMDIVAKHSEPDKNGARMAYLDEMEYKRQLWNHQPLTDFWRVGPGTRRRLEQHNMFTMGDVAKCSIENEKLLYKLFGVNSELLIDHAWGIEPCTIKSVKSYRPRTTSLSTSQVLHTPYTYDKARLVLKEMIEVQVLELVSKHYMTNLVTIGIGYDIENLTNPYIKKKYHGEIVIDHYGRYVPASAHGSTRFEKRTSSTKQIIHETIKLFDSIVNKNLLIRRLSINFANLESEQIASKEVIHKQFDLFLDNESFEKEKYKEIEDLKSEKALQKTIIELKSKFGKNAILKANNLEEGATMRMRNLEIGGHRG